MVQINTSEEYEMINTQLIERISALPPLPKTVTEIEKAYQNPNTDVKTIAKIVEGDPMVVANLLKLLNSAFYGLRKEITSVEQSISLLGMRGVKDLVVSISLRNMLRSNLSPYGTNSEKLAHISQFQSTLAFEMMRKTDAASAERIRLLGLLQEIGKLVIADEVLLEGEEGPFKAELDAGWDIREVERNYVDATTAEVSAAMLRHWDFDPLFADIIQWSDQPNQADEEYRKEAVILRIASEVVNIRTPLDENVINRGRLFVEKFYLPVDIYDEVVGKLADQWHNA